MKSKVNVKMFFIIALLLLFAFSLMGCSKSGSQKDNAQTKGETQKVAYPTKPVQIIIPTSAGGGTDLQVRAIAPFFKKYLGQDLINVCRPGGAGTIGTSEFLKAKPDGYTIGVAYIGPTSIQPLYGQTPYKVEDFNFICEFTKNPIVIAVKTNRYKTVEEFIEYGKTHELKYACMPGGAIDLAIQYFAEKTGIKLTNVPVEGSAPAVTGVLGGQYDAAAVHPQNIISYIKSGELKPIVIFEDKRLATLPDTPTAKEKGIDFSVAVWNGIAAPKDLPTDIRNKLVDGFKQICNDPEFIKAMETQGAVATYSTPEELTQKVKNEAVMFGEIIKKKGLAKK